MPRQDKGYRPAGGGDASEVQRQEWARVTNQIRRALSTMTIPARQDGRVVRLERAPEADDAVFRDACVVLCIALVGEVDRPPETLERQVPFIVPLPPGREKLVEHAAFELLAFVINASRRDPLPPARAAKLERLAGALRKVDQALHELEAEDFLALPESLHPVRHTDGRWRVPWWSPGWAPAIEAEARRLKSRGRNPDRIAQQGAEACARALERIHGRMPGKRDRRYQRLVAVVFALAGVDASAEDHAKRTARRLKGGGKNRPKKIDFAP